MKIGRYIVGLLSGVTFGVLFAPKKGKKLRTELFKKGSKSGQDGLAVLIDAFKEAGLEAVSEAKKLSDNEQIASAVSMSKEKMQEYLGQLEKTGYDIAARAKEKMEEITEVAEDASAEFKRTAVKTKRRATATAKKARRTVKKATRTVKKASAATKKTVKKVEKAAKNAEKVVKKAEKTVEKAIAKKTAPRKTATRKKTSVTKK